MEKLDKREKKIDKYNVDFCELDIEEKLNEKMQHFNHSSSKSLPEKVNQIRKFSDTDLNHLERVREEWIQKKNTNVDRSKEYGYNHDIDENIDVSINDEKSTVKRKNSWFSSNTLEESDKKEPTQKKGIKQKVNRISTFVDIVQHEIDSTYDAEERKKSAIKEILIKECKSKVGNTVSEKVRNVTKHITKKVVNLTKQLFYVAIKKLVALVTPLLPLVSIFFIISLCTCILLIAVVNKYEEEQRESQRGYFGKMYYWIEYETGKNNDEAFATVLGDEGRAFGIQFDYRYALQPFMRYCYSKNPDAYSDFIPFLNIPKNSLKGNQDLADVWKRIYSTNKDEFINDQKIYAKINYYNGIEEKASQYGIRLSDRDLVCKGAVLSFSFQCGFSAAYDAVVELNNIEDDEEFLKKIYEIRTRDYPSFVNRYEREYQTAYYLLKGKGDFVCPVNMAECVVSSEFGEYRSPSDPAHKGIDLASFGSKNVPIYSVADGEVLIAGYSSSAGNWVVIDHGNGLVAKYMHQESICVSVGQEVKKGQKIGNMGTTGNSTGVHLHFQLELNDIPINPREYIVF